MKSLLSQALLKELWSPERTTSWRELLSLLGRTVAGVVLSDSQKIRLAAAELSSSNPHDKVARVVLLTDVVAGLCQLLDAAATTVERQSATRAHALADRVLEELRKGPLCPTAMNEILFQRLANHKTLQKINRVLQKLRDEEIATVRTDSSQKDQRVRLYALTERGLSVASKLAGASTSDSLPRGSDEDDWLLPPVIPEVTREESEGEPADVEQTSIPRPRKESKRESRDKNSSLLTSAAKGASATRNLLKYQPVGSEDDDRWERMKKIELHSPTPQLAALVGVD